MQRDMDLVRQILLAVEADPDGKLPEAPVITGRSKDEVLYHLNLLRQAGLIEASSHIGARFAGIELTWSGHEFLDAARDETVWRRARATVGEKVGSVSLDVLKEVLGAVARAMLGLP